MAAKRPREEEEAAAAKPAMVDDVHIDRLGPLIPPCCLVEEIPLTATAAAHIQVAVDADTARRARLTAGRQERRRAVADCVSKHDDRLVVVVGPCSIHDVKVRGTLSRARGGRARALRVRPDRQPRSTRSS